MLINLYKYFYINACNIMMLLEIFIGITIHLCLILMVSLHIPFLNSEISPLFIKWCTLRLTIDGYFHVRGLHVFINT